MIRIQYSVIIVSVFVWCGFSLCMCSIDSYNNFNWKFINNFVTYRLYCFKVFIFCEFCDLFWYCLLFIVLYIESILTWHGFCLLFFCIITGCCFVTFYTRKAALKAQDALHNIKTLVGVSTTHTYKFCLFFLLSSSCYFSSSYVFYVIITSWNDIHLL